jgi:hypothetical protein
VKTLLLVAAERRELYGVLKRIGPASRMNWPEVKFAREAVWRGNRWWMIANGPGPANVRRALDPGTWGDIKNVDGIISTGYCGALDPALKVTDIVVSDSAGFETSLPYVCGEICSTDRVASTAAEKRLLREQTGALAVEMEAAAVKRAADQWGVPYTCIRVVSDAADQDLPLDFNKFRKTSGDFDLNRIALAAVARPFSVMLPLLEFDRNCRRASEILGDFLADCRF